MVAIFELAVKPDWHWQNKVYGNITYTVPLVTVDLLAIATVCKYWFQLVCTHLRCRKCLTVPQRLPCCYACYYRSLFVHPSYGLCIGNDYQWPYQVMCKCQRQNCGRFLCKLCKLYDPTHQLIKEACLNCNQLLCCTCCFISCKNCSNAYTDMTVCRNYFGFSLVDKVHRKEDVSFPGCEHCMVRCKRCKEYMHTTHKSSQSQAISYVVSYTSQLFVTADGGGYLYHCSKCQAAVSVPFFYKEYCSSCCYTLYKAWFEQREEPPTGDLMCTTCFEL